MLLGISLDLDNQWSYMKIHGDKGWEKYPSYLNIFLPRVLGVLNNLDLKVTFFIVGKDVSIEKNKEYLKMIVANGHTVGNHSYSHESWMHTFSVEKINYEIEETENLLGELLEQKPIGFRGPGFSWSPLILNTLLEKKYVYDASSLPTFIGPLARWFYFSKANLDEEMKNERSNLFGSFTDGFLRNKPYRWKNASSNKLLELPVTTMPIFKVPFHLSYLLYLSGISEQVMNLYLNMTINLCKVTKTPASFLLHPLDLIGKDIVPELSFFPAMDLSTEVKTELFEKVMNKLSYHFELVDLNTFALRMINNTEMKEKIIS